MTIDFYHHWLDGEWTISEDAIPAGSPERVMSRCVLQKEERHYVFEGSDLRRKGHRECQANTLETLQKRGCRHLLPWMRTRDGEFGICADELYWQCRPFVASLELDRNVYGQDEWRGIALASFLEDMRRSSDGMGHYHHPFYLAEYIPALMVRIQEKNPRLAQDLEPIVASLQKVLAAESEMRLVFSHGDFHPLNVLWGKQELRAVIDWEFSGPKPVLYDAANLVGCVGMDNPEFLTGKMVHAFLDNMLHEGMLTPRELAHLPAYMAALRFGWMREWCWRSEKEMMVQELDYIWLLLDNQQLLAERWNATKS